MSRYPSLDRYFPPAGPCAFCGHPDNRHRLWDVLIMCRNHGASIEQLAHDFNLPTKAVTAVLMVRPYTPHPRQMRSFGKKMTQTAREDAKK